MNCLPTMNMSSPSSTSTKWLSVAGTETEFIAPWLAVKELEQPQILRRKRDAVSLSQWCHQTLSFPLRLIHSCSPTLSPSPPGISECTIPLPAVIHCEEIKKPDQCPNLSKQVLSFHRLQYAGRDYSQSKQVIAYSLSAFIDCKTLEKIKARSVALDIVVVKQDITCYDCLRATSIKLMSIALYMAVLHRLNLHNFNI